MQRLSGQFKGFLTDKVFFGNMSRIAIPIMMQNLITSLLNMMDTVMVGALGETEIAAVGIANQYFFFFNMILIGLCGGCSVFVSQYWGKKDTSNIKRVLGIGLGSIVLISSIFMLLGFIAPAQIMSLFNKDLQVIALGAKYLQIALISYIFTGITLVYGQSLRSTGNTILPLKVGILALFTNIFFNYILIFGKLGVPALGVEGAAIATVTARILETCVLVDLIYKINSPLKARVKELLDFKFSFVKRAYRIIFPVILNDMLWGLATLVYTAVYGRMGTGAIAAIQICNTVSNLFMVASHGLSNAAAIMIGNSIGAGKQEESKDYAKKFIFISTIVGVLMGIVLAITSPEILNFFNISASVKNSAQSILYIISLVFVIRVVGMTIIIGIMRGGGDAKSSLIIEGFTMWCIGIPLIMIGAFVLKLPVHLVYAMALAEELSKAIIGLFRLKSGKWLNDLTN